MCVCVCVCVCVRAVGGKQAVGHCEVREGESKHLLT